MLPDWSDVFHTLKVSVRVAINAKDLYKDTQDGKEEEHRETEHGSPAQSAVNGSECTSTLHADLIFGNSSQLLQKQNVLAVKRSPPIQLCHDCTSKCWKEIEPSEIQTILYQQT